MRFRRTFIVALAFGLFAVPLAADAQQAAKVWRIGILTNAPGPHWDAFRQGLHQLGYVEGQDLAFENRWAEEGFGGLPALAGELVRLRVDLIVTQGTPAARAAKEATTTIPIVAASVGDPVGTGLVASLARPGGNLTGLSDIAVDLSAKRLEFLKEVVPTAARIAVLWNPAHPTNPLQLREIEIAAHALGMTLQSWEVRGSDDLERTFAAMRKERAGVLVVLANPLMLRHRGRLADLAANNRLPAMYPFREYVEAGGLMFYGPSLSDLFRRAATLVDKILKGAKPADLPVEQPTRFELIINLKTAKTLGLAIPQSVLIRADEVIQ